MLKLRILSLFLFSFFLLPAYGQKLEKQAIRVATIEWPPYTTENSNNHGVASKELTKFFSKTKYKPHLLFFPWARALKYLKVGFVDALFPEYYDKAREKYCAFSKPILSSPAGLLKRSDNFINEKEIYSGKYSFSLVTGYINNSKIDENDKLSKTYVSSDELNIQLLIQRKVDLIYIDEKVARYLQKKLNDKTKLEFIKSHMDNKKLYICFSKKNPNYKSILKSFNDSLDKN